MRRSELFCEDAFFILLCLQIKSKDDSKTEKDKTMKGVKKSAETGTFSIIHVIVSWWAFLLLVFYIAV